MWFYKNKIKHWTGKETDGYPSYLAKPNISEYDLINKPCFIYKPIDNTVPNNYSYYVKFRIELSNDGFWEYIYYFNILPSATYYSTQNGDPWYVAIEFSEYVTFWRIFRNESHPDWYDIEEFTVQSQGLSEYKYATNIYIWSNFQIYEKNTLIPYQTYYPQTYYFVICDNLNAKLKYYSNTNKLYANIVYPDIFRKAYWYADQGYWNFNIEQSTIELFPSEITWCNYNILNNDTNEIWRKSDYEISDWKYGNIKYYDL